MSNREVGMPMLVAYLGLWWGGLAAGFIFVTGNTAPPPPSIAWAEEEAVTSTKLAVEIVEDSADVDGDKIEYFYSWTRDGEVVEGKSGASVSGRETMAGEVWEVQVTPNDGTFESWGCNLPWRDCAAAGKGVATLSVTIGNSPPRARIRFVDAEGEEFADDEAPRNKDIHLKLSCFDPDVADLTRKEREEAKAAGIEAPPKPEKTEGSEGEEGAEGSEAEEEEEEDPCTYTVAWWRTDDEPDEDEESEHTGMVLSKRTTKLEESWRAVVIANDGEADGEPQEETITIIR